MKIRLLALMGSVSLLAACDSPAEDADDAREDAVEARAAAAGPAVVALGLSEARLLEADLVDAGGLELGDVEDVLRGPDGQVDRLLIEVEDSNPDRFVEVPITDLSAVARGNDTDLRPAMTRDQLAGLPAVTPGAP